MKKFVIKRVNKKRRLRRIKKTLAAVGISVASLLSLLVIYNKVRSCSVNNDDITIDPFTPEHLFDEDLEFDDNGQIVFDSMTDEEKQILSNQFEKFILQDANRSLKQPIEKVDDILSINFFPSNLYSENDSNIYNQYYLSILFNDGNKNYTLNYFTGSTFITEEELTKNKLTDFINYLSYDCAQYNCEAMSKIGQDISTALGEEVCYVGNTYQGHKQSGENIYCIPIYYADGKACVYSATKTIIDMDDLNPMKEFYDEITQPDKEKLFSNSSCEKDANVEEILKIYNDITKENTTEELKK